MLAISRKLSLITSTFQALSRASLHVTVRNASDRLYTKRHEWILVDPSDKSLGIVGVSAHAQEALGDVVYVELPDVGAKFERGETAGAVESVKAASDIYAPVTGMVKEKNSNVEDSPTLINKSPYEKGWLFKIQFENPQQLADLMDETAYERYRTHEHEDE